MDKNETRPQGGLDDDLRVARAPFHSLELKEEGRREIVDLSHEGELRVLIRDRRREDVVVEEPELGDRGGSEKPRPLIEAEALVVVLALLQGAIEKDSDGFSFWFDNLGFHLTDLSHLKI